MLSKRVCPTSTTKGKRIFSASFWYSFYNYFQFDTISKTGIVYNVTKSSVGVIINKQVGNRYIEKRINIRVEHIKHSKCRLEFLRRVKSNARAKADAKAKGGMLLFVFIPFIH